jgi:hypothetical protein
MSDIRRTVILRLLFILIGRRLIHVFTSVSSVGSGSLGLAECISESAKLKPGSKHKEQNESNKAR